MRTEIENVLKSVLPVCVPIIVQESKSSFGGDYIKIAFSAKDFNINGVSGQKPQIVSLVFYPDRMELKPQVFGGNGGRTIFRKPNLEDSREKYLCMKSVVLPFRTPKPEKEAVLRAVKKFAENWLLTLRENRDVLMYQEYVDYNEILK